MTSQTPLLALLLIPEAPVLSIGQTVLY